MWSHNSWKSFNVCCCCWWTQRTDLPLDQLANFLLQETLCISVIITIISDIHWPAIPVEGRHIMEADSVRIFQFPNEFVQWEAVSTVFTLYQTKVSHISSVETLEFKTSHQMNEVNPQIFQAAEIEDFLTYYIFHLNFKIWLGLIKYKRLTLKNMTPVRDMNLLI